MGCTMSVRSTERALGNLMGESNDVLGHSVAEISRGHPESLKTGLNLIEDMESK